MISISKMYMGLDSESDHLRYGRGHGTEPGERPHGRPVVVWNVTRRCNLHCLHCYAHATDGAGENELSHAEALAMIDDLAAYGAPVLLFSGGEPLLRPDLVELIGYARSRGLRPVISTNGTRITAAMAVAFKAAGVAYVGVSLDGLRTTNDRFRGVEGAFDEALDGIRACLRAGVKVGLRYTLTRDNVADLPGMLDLLETEAIPRACFYHLVYTGRGSQQADLLPQETRAAVDRIIDRAARLHRLGRAIELLTVANHADGPYLYLRMRREGHPGAARALELLRRCGGNSSGVGIGCIGWDGAVYPDQFWRQRVLGNIREKPFSRIWNETAATPFSQALKEKEKHVTGRCARCRFLAVCGGNMRSRAEVATGDIWAPDPACYLTEEEIRAEDGKG